MARSKRRWPKRCTVSATPTTSHEPSAGVPHATRAVARIEKKFSELAELISRSDPDLAKTLRTAWQLPARSLAFRNAEHRKKE